MVARTGENKPQRRIKQGANETPQSPIKIKGNTPFELCQERLSAFGGFLALIKFIETIQMQEVFQRHWISPSRIPQLGCWRMVMGCLSLLYIGFQRIGQFAYIRTDPMLCGFFQVTRLPAVSTYWRYLRSLTINQSRMLLRIGAQLRERVWRLTGIVLKKIHINIDTTVSTIYGNIEGSRKGHNTKHRGKKGLRPILLFIEETREYLSGSQRRGETISGKDVARHIRESRQYLPSTVGKVVVRADAEFVGWESICACKENNYGFIFSNKRCTPQYPQSGWYRYGDYEYNEAMYQSHGWGEPVRFVVMRIKQDQIGDRQLEIFDKDNYTYRDFATDQKAAPHKVIEEYDGRADVENCIGEAQRAGLLAIPSKSFASNHVFFQIVMLAYNLWRWMNLTAIASNQESAPKQHEDRPVKIAEQPSSTITVLRLKTLFIAAKIILHADQAKVRYSVHDARSAPIIDFLNYLDSKLQLKIDWDKPVLVTPYRQTG
jgi:hypothetical protein